MLYCMSWDILGPMFCLIFRELYVLPKWVWGLESEFKMSSYFGGRPRILLEAGGNHVPFVTSCLFHCHLIFVPRRQGLLIDFLPGKFLIFCSVTLRNIKLRSVPNSEPCKILRLFQHTELEHTPSNLYQQDINGFLS